MSDKNLTLYVATYDDAASAQGDYYALKDNLDDDFSVEGAVVMSRDITGKVDVLEKGDGNTAGGAAIGGGIGLVVGLFAPPLLAATAIGAGIGAVLGHFEKKYEEKELGVELGEYFPPDSSAVAVVFDDTYLDQVEAALGKSVKSISKAIDSGDYDKLIKSLEDSDDRMEDAIES